MLKNNGVRVSYSFYRSDKISLPKEFKQLSVKLSQEKYIVVYELFVLGLEGR